VIDAFGALASREYIVKSAELYDAGVAKLRSGNIKKSDNKSRPLNPHVEKLLRFADLMARLRA